MKANKPDSFLFGPFIGEVNWEFFQFAPYVIHLKKEHPDKKVIVFTRPERFDFYGMYADILVPLKLPNDEMDKQYCFTIKGFKKDDYDLLHLSYINQYKNRFNIIEYVYPDISLFYYKLRWQFSRELMNYDFKPRQTNKKIIDNYVFTNDILCNMDEVDFDADNIKNVKDLNLKYIESIDSNSSLYGCLIESIKKSKCVIANFSSNTARLALLLKKPVITINDTFTDDEIHLLNPYNTSVIRASNIKEGVKIYEDNF